MSKLIVAGPKMHKIAEFPVKVKYRQLENVPEYIPVEFEIFVDGEYYKALPLESFEKRMLANLPNELKFQTKNGQIENCKKESQEVIEEIVRKLFEMNVVETPSKTTKGTDTNRGVFQC
jgi:hypothetical protein